MIFFFCGPNTFASRRKMDEIVARYTKKTGSDFGLERINGSEVSYKDLEAALLAVPLLSSSRLVIIDRLSENKAVSPRVEELLDKIPESTVAIFYEAEVDERSLYFKAMHKKAKGVKFAQPDKNQLAAWIGREVEKLGGKVDRPTIHLLIERAGEDQWRLEQEIVKLVSYQKEVTVDVIEKLVVSNEHQDVFKLVEAVAGHQTKKALGVYRGLLSDQVGEVYILSMIIWQLRNLLLAKTAGNLTPPELAKKAGMSPYVAGKVMAARRNYEEEDLKEAYLLAIDTDYRVKSGQGEPSWLVEDLIYKLSSR